MASRDGARCNACHDVVSVCVLLLLLRQHVRHALRRPGLVLLSVRPALFKRYVAASWFSVAQLEIPTVFPTGDSNPQPEETGFDPTSPYAFHPPDYSLPKDPPKYADLVTGSDNAAFQSSSSNLNPDSDVTHASTSTSTAVVGDVTTVSAPDDFHDAPPPQYEESEAQHNAALTTQHLTHEPAPVHAPSNDVDNLPNPGVTPTQNTKTSESAETPVVV